MTHENAPADTITPVAHPIPAAARVAGVSVRSIRYAVERGELTLHYPTARPVILRADLLTWLATAPTTRQTTTGRQAAAATS